MAIQIVVRESEIDQRIAAALVKLRDGLLLARAAGINAEYPKTLDVRMTVLAEFEVLTTTDFETSYNNDELTGESLDTITEPIEVVTNTGTDTTVTGGADGHVQTSSSHQTNQTV